MARQGRALGFREKPPGDDDSSARVSRADKVMHRFRKTTSVISGSTMPKMTASGAGPPLRRDKASVAVGTTDACHPAPSSRSWCMARLSGVGIHDEDGEGRGGAGADHTDVASLLLSRL
jgi:hypothetical protein